MQPNQFVVVIAEVILGAFVLLPYSDPVQKATALGALVGIVGGHLNGSRSSRAAISEATP